MRRLLCAAGLAVVVATAVPASAQAPAGAEPDRGIALAPDASPRADAAPVQVLRPGPPPAYQVGTRAFFLYDALTMRATDTFNAVLGKDRLYGWGGGIDIMRRGPGPFVRFGVSLFREDGERVFVIEGETVPIGVPLRLEMTPLELGGGWRQPLVRDRRVEAYGGAGGLFVKYKETSDFGTDEDNTDEWFRGYLAFGGVDVDVWNGLFVGVEAQYRVIPNAIGDSGVSGIFGEDDLGGFAIRFLVGGKN